MWLRTRWPAALAIAVMATACTGERPAERPRAAPSAASSSPTSTASPTGDASLPSPAPSHAMFVEVRDDRAAPEGVELGAGVCMPATVRFPHPVDCSFPIVEGTPAALEGWAVARLRGPDEVESEIPDALRGSRSETCVVEARDLVCRRIEPANLDRTVSVPVVVAIGEASVRTASTVNLLPEAEAPAAVLVANAAAAVAGTVAGAPTPVSVRRAAGDGPVWLLLRSWPRQEVVQSVAALGAGDDQAWVELTVEDPGEYDVVTCVGPDAVQCEPDVSGPRLLVVDPRPAPLVAGHNGPGNRIDVVITGRGFRSHDDFADAARVLFDPAGAPILDVGQTPPDLHMPVFAIEPLRSLAHRFNLWVIPHPFTPEAFFPGCGSRSDDPECPAGHTSRSLDPGLLGLQDVTFVELVGLPAVDVLARHGYAPGAAMQAFSRVDPAWASGAPAPPTRRDDWVLGPYANIAVEIGRPWTSDHVASHEIGHSWFGFEEEYGGPDVLGEGTSADARPGPGCTSSVELARARWGDLLGDVDPFAEEFATLLRAAGIPGPDVVELARIDVVAGCPAGVKASASSVMENRFEGIPVYNSVNRRWVEGILDLWD